MSAWSAWKLDVFTWGWILWIVFFLVWETAAILSGYRDTLTAHLRPLWLEHPLTWFLALGLYLWIGVHFLAPTLEAWLFDAVRGGDH